MKAVKAAKKTLRAMLPHNSSQSAKANGELTVSMLQTGITDDADDRAMLNRCGEEQSQAPIHGEYSFFECSRVCVHWRQVALNTPALWSKVNFSTPKWVQICVRRSKSSPLIVECHLTDFILSRKQPTTPQRVGAVLELAKPRIKEIFLYSHVSDDSLLRALRGGFPLLTKMSITGITAYSTSIGHNRELLYPSLRFLHLNAPIPLLYHTGPKLRSLKIACYIDMLLLNALSVHTNLEELTIYLFKAYPDPVLPEHPTLLPNLCSSARSPSPSSLERCFMQYWQQPASAQSDVNAVLRTHFPPTASQVSLRFHREEFGLAYTAKNVDIGLRFSSQDGSANIGHRELVFAWHEYPLVPTAFSVSLPSLPTTSRDMPFARIMTSVETIVLDNWALASGEETLLWQDILSSLPALHSIKLRRYEEGQIQKWNEVVASIPGSDAVALDMIALGDTLDWEDFKETS
ncbi:hypothetical protein MIND_00801000 [Mycena indigotica]|uniref:F-box domain-containing protein n=1 Tax=Mycena indigotica TaxID=2126181 RepID=A0A8H6SFF9_9AGAR|nr:uncharacterized protein MIND_00801000 [Mycena indigotica]KAF7298543.1 hypothetical protein MIND_00801000 [Mycena indigotica]